jgi:hypothetical protein
MRVRTKMRGIGFLFIACLFAQFSCQWGSDAITYDGFETPTLRNIWKSRYFIPGAVEMQSGIVRAGKNAVRIILRPGDQIDKEKGTILERAEVLQARPMWAREGSNYSYSFSMFLPKDFPITSTRLVIAQWKQNCPGDNCYPDNPTLAVRYIAHELLVTHKVKAEEDVLYRTTNEIRGKWLDFRFHLRFSKKDGLIKAWLNNEAIIDYQGPNAYPASGGYPEQNRFYFKFGIYRDKSPETMMLYVDEFRREEVIRF